MRRIIPALLFSLGACGDEPVSTNDTEITPDQDVEISGDSDTSPDVVLSLDEPIPAGRVLVAQAEHAGQLIQGLKAEGRVGDYVFANEQARFVVEGVRRAGGYRMWGGNLVDVSIRGTQDLFGELWFAWNIEVFVPEKAEIVSDGSDGVAHVRFEGKSDNYPWPDSFISPMLNPPPADLKVIYDWRLAPDAAKIELTVTLINEKEEEVDLAWPLMAMNMGDGVKSYAPVVGFSGVAAANGLKWLGALGPEASYGMYSDTTAFSGAFSYANMDLLIMDTMKIAPGEEGVYRFHYMVSADGSPGIDAQVVGSPATKKVSGTVEGAPEGAWVALVDGYKVGAVAFVQDGAFEALVPEGTWEVTAYALDRAASNTVEVEAGAEGVALGIPEPASIVATIRDADSGEPVPAQLIFKGAEETPSPYAPSRVRFMETWGADRDKVVYVTEPGTTAQLPAGEYTVYATRGYSYEVTEWTVDLKPGENDAIDVSVQRAVDTTGWSASDFHVHAMWSSDSDVPYATRVKEAATNDIALPILSEHAYVGDVLGLAEEMGLADYVALIPAQEVTTFEYGHFNTFPLVYYPDEIAGGSIFEHGLDGAELFDVMRAQQPDDILIQINHPRNSVAFFAYFDYIGLNSLTGEIANPARFSQDWELVEAFNGRCLGSAENVESRADWINMTNLGWGKVLSSGSDSHTVASGMGLPRNWVKVDHLEVGADPQAIVAPIRAAQTFVSCGPFVHFETAGGQGMGELVAVDEEGKVQLEIRVEAPSWMQIASLVVLENGVPVEEISFDNLTAGPDGDRPAVRYEGVIEVAPEADSWYAVEVFGSGDLYPLSSFGTPYALTNGIMVDVDGDGDWTAPGPIDTDKGKALFAQANEKARIADEQRGAPHDHVYVNPNWLHVFGPLLDRKGH